MITKDEFQAKIDSNEKLLKTLLVKKENLEKQITNLTEKIENQKFSLKHMK